MQPAFNVTLFTLDKNHKFAYVSVLAIAKMSTNIKTIKILKLIFQIIIIKKRFN